MATPEYYNEEIERFLSMSEADLFNELGTRLRTRGMGAAPAGGRNEKVFGEDWYRRNADRLRSLVCSHQIAATFLTSHRQFQRIEIIVGVAEILQPPYVTLATRAVLAVLIAKEGLASFCKSHRAE